MRTNKIISLGVVSFLALSWAAQATIIQYRASLSGPAEDPPVASPGVGTAIVTHDMNAHTLRIQIEFSGLVGVTTVAHIHAPTAIPGAGNVGVAVYPGTFPGFPVGVMSGTYDHTVDLADAGSYPANFLNNSGGGTAAGAEAALATAMGEGRAYVNIHTSFSPPGEIRGFLGVPDASSTAMLLAAALLGLACVVRSNHKRTA